MKSLFPKAALVLSTAAILASCSRVELTSNSNTPHVLSVECDEPCGATPVDASTWGRIKSLHQ